ncbi:cyclase-associated protein 1-like [Salvia divinorum]|uniref:Cyclase-associated protein 1-like n=1 Tax=Salvia divinorum TaxID=28513 RepID=A0ABD1GJG4_SALDI
MLKKPSVSKAGPPTLELQLGRKWVVENQIGQKELVNDDLRGCKADSIGKVNNITLDKCSKMGLVFQDPACELVNCSSTEVQCQGVAPTILIEVNALVPASEADGDWTEHPLPVQYIHAYKDGQIVTTPMDHSGG